MYIYHLHRFTAMSNMKDLEHDENGCQNRNLLASSSTHIKRSYLRSFVCLHGYISLYDEAAAKDVDVAPGSVKPLLDPRTAKTTLLCELSTWHHLYV